MIKLTRKQAIQWAHDAGLINKEDYSIEHMGALADDIQRFASVAYEAGQKDERDACAGVCDNFEHLNWDYMTGARMCANLIRKRGRNENIS